MTCSLCGDIALRVVGTKGFCKVHEGDAFELQTQLTRRTDSYRGDNFFSVAQSTISERRLQRDQPI